MGYSRRPVDWNNVRLLSDARCDLWGSVVTLVLTAKGGDAAALDAAVCNVPSPMVLGATSG